MVVVSARALVVEVRLGQRGGIGLARPAILPLAATGGPGASQSAGGLAERHALPVGAQPCLASHFMSLRESWGKWHESWKYDIQKVVIRESQGVIQRV